MKDIDQILSRPVTSGKNIGIVAGIVKRDETRVLTFGKAARNSSTELAGDSIFEIGSITKLFTATLLANMINDGLLGLNDSVSRFLPDSVGAQRIKSHQVTLFHLVTHTSGLPSTPSKVWLQFIGQFVKQRGRGIQIRMLGILSMIYMNFSQTTDLKGDRAKYTNTLTLAMRC